MTLLPRGDQVAPVQALADLVIVFGVALRNGHELAAATADQHVRTVAEGRFDHLPCDVVATRLHRRVGQRGIVLPIAVRGMAECRAQRGVGNARGADHSLASRASAASSHKVSIGAASAPAQSPRLPTAELSTPSRVFTPVAIALMVPAGSGVWVSVL